MSRESEPINIFNNPVAERRFQRAKNAPEFLAIPKPLEKPRPKILSGPQLRSLRKGIAMGIFNEGAEEDTHIQKRLKANLKSAIHEGLHWAALAGLENAGYRVRRRNMTVIPNGDYRAATFFSVDQDAPIAEKAWISLVAAQGSGAPDIFDWEYNHQGRGGDQSQEDHAADIISFVQYRRRVSPAAIKSQARSVSHGYAKQYADQGVILRLVRDLQIA